MFRPHNAELARQEEAQDQAAATAKFETHSDEWFAEVRLLDLLRTSRIGLMDCYDSFENSLFDFYAGFGWGGDAMKRQIQLVMADPRFGPIAADIQAKFDFDMRAELEAALVDESLDEDQG
jgi:hypothetical protein